jgi:exosortase
MGRQLVKRRVSIADVSRDPGVRRGFRLGLAVLALVTITVWAYWWTMVGVFDAWRSNDDYSAGQLVPLVAVFLVWRKRDALRQCTLSPCWWVGVPLLLFAQVAATYGVLSFRFSAERYAFVLTIMALVLLVLGREVFQRLFWILIFLFLMFPLPGRIHGAISDPLQNLATTGSVFLLESTGMRVSQQGNIVMLNDSIPMAVAEACSGLRMLTAFIIVAAFVASVIKRSGLQKVILLVSSIPIAVVCNMLRISLTAVVMLHVSVKVGEKFFHDFAGVVMMPAAVMLIFGLLWLMDHLTVAEVGATQDQIIRRTRRAKSSRSSGGCDKRGGRGQ